MPAQLIDGNLLSKKLRAEIATRSAILTAKGVRPGLAVIVVGDDPASQVYVRNKVKACEDVGFHSVLERYPAELDEAQLLARIATLNADPSIHGILVQLPLPKHISAERVLESIDSDKDVDGFHIANAGALMVGAPLFKPCTPYGCMKMLESIEYPLRGARAVIIGASNIVGKPMAMLLLQAGATVTICNSKTKDLSAHTKEADVLVVATGKPKMITGNMVKPGSVVIDVGINRLPDGKLCGDVDFDTAKYVAGWITPVPGGVGPMAQGKMIEDNVVEIGLWFHEEGYGIDNSVYKQDLSLYQISPQGDLVIEPNGYQMTQGFHSFDHPVRLDSFQPHGHLRMRHASLEIFYPETGRTEAISQVSNWSATWHHSHIFGEDSAPLLPAGAVLVLKQWYDNTSDNPNNPDSDQWVVGGSRTGDEMTHAWIAVTHLDDAGFEKLVADRKEKEERAVAGND